MTPAPAGTCHRLVPLSSPLSSPLTTLLFICFVAETKSSLTWNLPPYFWFTQPYSRELEGDWCSCSSPLSWRWKAILHRERSPGESTAQTGVARPDCSESQCRLLLVTIFAHQQVPGRSYFGGFWNL
jgi:hypothetical protein